MFIFAGELPRKGFLLFLFGFAVLRPHTAGFYYVYIFAEEHPRKGFLLFLFGFAVWHLCTLQVFFAARRHPPGGAPHSSVRSTTLRRLAGRARAPGEPTR